MNVDFLFESMNCSSHSLSEMRRIRRTQVRLGLLITSDLHVEVNELICRSNNFGATIELDRRSDIE
jgi:hypothetical protein